MQESVQIKEIMIPDEKKTCSADDLFSYIVQNVIDFADSAGRLGAFVITKST